MVTKLAYPTCAPHLAGCYVRNERRQAGLVNFMVTNTLNLQIPWCLVRHPTPTQSAVVLRKTGEKSGAEGPPRIVLNCITIRSCPVSTWKNSPTKNSKKIISETPKRVSKRPNSFNAIPAWSPGWYHIHHSVPHQPLLEPSKDPSKEFR